jgi:N-acetylglutamate synthase-like GNAT family acetyltransferase
VGVAARPGLRPSGASESISIDEISKKGGIAMKIRMTNDKDFKEIYNIINDAACAYKGIIPDDMWHEPYMTESELSIQINDGVVFLCCENEKEIQGVMGYQDKKDVFLIRHAYVRTKNRKSGIGSNLLNEIIKKIDKPILIGTWAAASWAIKFYEKNGFSLVSEQERERLLRTYWKISERQIATSVVLANSGYF